MLDKETVNLRAIDRIKKTCWGASITKEFQAAFGQGSKLEKE